MSGNRDLLLFVLMGGLLSAHNCQSADTSPEDMTSKSEWVAQNLLSEKNALPFSFNYAGQPSTTLLPAWTRKATSNKLDANRTEHILTWTDAKSGLEVRCRAVDYSDFPV